MDRLPIKVAIISNTLSSGGAERFAASLGFMLQNIGCEVHNIVVNDKIDYEFAGVLFNLEKESLTSNPFLRKLNKGFLLQRYLNDHHIDTIIDNRSRGIFLREWFTKWIYGKRNKLFIVHSFHLLSYFPDSVWAAKFLYSDAKKIICVSKAIETEVQHKYGLQNTETILNSIDLNNLKLRSALHSNEKYILYFGRLEEKVKNFTLMLEAFKFSEINKLGYKLIIMGNGPDKNLILQQLNRLEIANDVVLLPFQSNPFNEVMNAKFTVLTSYYEGFPMSIIESLALGTPVVAVDCKSGPSEVIIDEHNGLLVQNHNVKALADAFKRLVSDSNLYDICKTNARSSILPLSVDKIALKWQQILFE